MKAKDKKVIVTGAGAGIGKELVKQLLEKKSKVIGIDINEENLNNLKSELNNENFSIYKVDISNEESINEFLKNCSETDILINNAGIIQPFLNIDKLEMDIINKVMDVNFYGPLKLTKALLPKMIEKKQGHIVNVSSMGGFFPFPGQTIYGASKAALKIFTEGMYAELLDKNVKVTLALPGAIATDIAKNSNLEVKQTDTKMKMLSAKDAAKQIIDAMEKDKFKVYVGSDSKMMNLMYKLNDEKAIKFINKKMKETM